MEYCLAVMSGGCLILPSMWLLAQVAPARTAPFSSKQSVHCCQRRCLLTASICFIKPRTWATNGSAG